MILKKSKRNAWNIIIVKKKEYVQNNNNRKQKKIQSGKEFQMQKKS